MVKERLNMKNHFGIVLITVAISTLFVLVLTDKYGDKKQPIIVKDEENQVTLIQPELKEIELEKKEEPKQASYTPDFHLETIDYGNGKTANGFLVDNKKEGVWTYYDNGHVYQTLTYRGDVLDGYSVLYDAFGKKVSEGLYVDDKQSGFWHAFKDDTLIRIDSFVAGERVNYFTVWLR